METQPIDGILPFYDDNQVTGIRFGSCENYNDTLKLCEHVKIYRVEKYYNNQNDCCEYTEELSVSCELCKKIFTVVLLIN